jgi:CRP-like cAMP-binding protein
MFEYLLEIIKGNNQISAQFQGSLIERQVAAKTVLLNEGEISTHAHLIKEGCLREWFNKDGKEITFQFFFEGQAVASIDSFLNNQPSLYTIESVEPSIIYSISKDKFEEMFQLMPEVRERLHELMYKRFRNYANLFLSRIRDTPKERYDDLILNHPQIIKRVPQHYIASYLGITPTSLSRIRNRR